MVSMKDELQSWNFSIYAQWLGILCIILDIAFGIGNIFTSVIIWGIFSIVFGVVLIFVEVPFLLRICPTNKAFDDGIRKFNNNYPRAALYLALAVVLWLSIIQRASSLIVAAVFMTLTAACYAFAGLKNTEFTQSKTLGGAGLVQMVV